jgi:hypothetical protein
MMGNTKIQLKDNIKELYKDQKDQQSRGIRTSNVTPTKANSNQIQNMNTSSVTHTLNAA